ncbi:TlpA disulfide reductase family protein [Hanstruepera ponticola]|uniref:TlpA disulfide reductase family protein n=1 Tax=Hanstruepera ponticola TaxID=2042995 RepID=UPI000CF066B8|nr:TlpA disulfide reductase family protein [Hanstruepera ponticola]
MIKKLLILVLVIGFVSCEKESKPEGFVVNASIDESVNGKVAKLTNVDPKNPYVLDTALVSNGNVTFKGNVKQPDMFVLTIDGVSGSLPMMIENKSIEVNLYEGELHNSIINGSKENDIYKTFRDNTGPLREYNQTLGETYRKAQLSDDKATMQAVKKKFDSLVEINTQESIKIIKENNDLVISVFMLQNFLQSKKIDSKQASEILNSFTDEVKKSRAAQEVKDIIEASLTTEIGSVAPNFSAPDPDGKIISLQDIKGKVTIIDFWAAWCGPCRRENPNVVKVYNKYHDKGLEIIGVSLDGTKRQNNPKDAWVNAIASDSLNWHHVSNLNYFNDPVAKLYNINSIPATFILDENGKIIAKNLRGSALEQKISELLD